MTEDVRFRLAVRKDLDALVRMLADDPLGASRETIAESLPECYIRAFAAIDADPLNELHVVTVDERVVGVAQLTFLPNLSHSGAWRAQIEGVRVDASMRSSGLGRRLFEHLVSEAERRGCALVQLTSDKTRTDALRFYESLGFTPSHIGFKRRLDVDGAGPAAGDAQVLRDRVSRFYSELWDAHDRTAAERLLHPEVTFRGSLGDEHHGPAGVQSYVDGVHAALGDYRCHIETLVVEPPMAFARMRFEGLHRGRFLGFEPTGRHVRWSGTAQFTFDGPLIRDVWVLGDLHSLVADLESAAGTSA